MSETITGRQGVCGTCGHPLPHKWSVTGKTECKLCDGGLCIPMDAQIIAIDSAESMPSNPGIMGMSIIREMSKAELITELLLNARVQLNDQPLEHLRRMVVATRTHAVRKRLEDEAGVTYESPFFGGGLDV